MSLKYLGKVYSVLGVFFSVLRGSVCECPRPQLGARELFRFQQLPAGECVPAAGLDRRDAGLGSAGLTVTKDQKFKSDYSSGETSGGVTDTSGPGRVRSARL